jgi:hypothetical protein
MTAVGAAPRIRRRELASATYPSDYNAAKRTGVPNGQRVQENGNRMLVGTDDGNRHSRAVAELSLAPKACALPLQRLDSRELYAPTQLIDRLRSKRQPFTTNINTSRR